MKFCDLVYVYMESLEALVVFLCKKKIFIKYYILIVEYYRFKGKKRRKLRRKKKERKYYFQLVENIWLFMDFSRRYNFYIVVINYGKYFLKINVVIVV